MPILDPRVDAYIAESGEFARPILEHLRKLVHAACPEVTEHIKWSSPHFLLDKPIVVTGLMGGASLHDPPEPEIQIERRGAQRVERKVLPGAVAP